MVADGDFGAPYAGAGRLRLHLRCPAVVAVPHVEGEKRLVADGAERAEIGEPVAVEKVKHESGEPVPPSGVRGEGAPLSLAQNPRADHEVDPALQDGLHELRHFAGAVAVVSVHEDHDVGRLFREVGDSREAGLPVARAGLEEHGGALGLRDLGRSVTASVVDDHDLACERSWYFGENLGERALFVERGNDDDNPHWACWLSV